MSWHHLVISHQKKQPQEKDKTHQKYTRLAATVFEDLNTGMPSVLTIESVWSLSYFPALRTLVIPFAKPRYL